MPAVGASAGSRNVHRTPSGSPASPSIQPSCPPPSTVTCVMAGTLAIPPGAYPSMAKGGISVSVSAGSSWRNASILSSGRCKARWRVLMSAA